VAIIELRAPLAVGDCILVRGPSTDFEQVVESMQIEHINIQRAESGQSIGLKTVQLAKNGMLSTRNYRSVLPLLSLRKLILPALDMIAKALI